MFFVLYDHFFLFNVHPDSEIPSSSLPLLAGSGLAISPSTFSHQTFFVQLSMNQHASRPVAQGFPLHRRMNGPIQSSGPGRATQLPSVLTNGGPLRRSLGFSSQIPIRIGFGNQSSSQQASLRARVLERHRQSLVNNSTSHQSSAAAAAAAAATHQAMRTSASASPSQQQQQQPIDNAFKVYEDRLQTDFRDFRAMCSRLILQEKEEKEKWHSLCLKLMKERDTARQRINALISERGTHLSSSSAVPASSSAQEKNVTSKASKRGRDESTSSAAQELPSSRSSPVESRPIRSLRLSPISSPPGSPSASLYNSSTAINPSSLPSAPSESPPPSSSNANVAVLTSTASSTPCSDSTPVSPLNIMTFNPARSPNDKTCFDVFGEFDIPESRPVKRRKSYDSSDKKTGETKGSSNSEKDMSDDEPLPFLIAHTDIMYMPMKGRLYCRACLLDKTTNPSNRNPKTFPTNVNWNELRDHCVSEHPTACKDVARLCPADLNELRRRLYK